MAMLAGAAVIVCGAAGATVVPAPGFTVRTFPTPDTVAGGVLREGNALIVGQGTFGSGGERIVRLDGARATTIADGFSSLGGFDVSGGTLYAVDNCFGTDSGCGAPTTGDTVYAIADPTARTTSASAAGSELVPSGTFAAPQDVLVLPGPIVLVSDAIGVGAGRIAKIVGTSVTNLVTGLDFLGGLATDGTELFVANVDGSFAGSVQRFALTGTPHPPLIGGLSGSYGVARDAAGNVLVTGGFTGDFSSSTLVAVNGLGVASERAHGFAFSGDVFVDAARGTALVLDFGATAVAGICADADGDDVCDADCAGPAAVAKPKLKLGKQAAPVGDETLTFTGEMTIPSAPPLDPVAHGAIVLVDDADGRVVVDVAIPGGTYDETTKTGWKANDAGTSWTYKNPTGVVGITKVKAKASTKTTGLVTFQVTGKNGAYDTTGATLPLHAVFALGASGQCGLATFPGPSPACALNGKGTTLVCK
jgi:hypothetical protein